MVVYIALTEMEEEYLNIDEAPTLDVQTKTTDQAQEKTPKSETGSYSWVIVSFGLLCVLQATLNISLRLTFSNNQFETSNTNRTRERDQLQTSNTILTTKRDQLQTSNTILIRQRDQLQTSNTNLTRERDQLQISNTNLTRERDQLQTSNTNQTTREKELKRPCEVTSCSDGWLKFGCSCYYVSTQMKNWANSRQDCRRRGADLVIINSPEEQDFLSTKIDRVWIGLSDRQGEGTFIWVDGTPLTTSFWDHGEPNDKNGHEDCVELLSKKVWNDHACDFNWQWICEKVI